MTLLTKTTLSATTIYHLAEFRPKLHKARKVKKSKIRTLGVTFQNIGTARHRISKAHVHVYLMKTLTKHGKNMTYVNNTYTKMLLVSRRNLTLKVSFQSRLRIEWANPAKREIGVTSQKTGRKMVLNSNTILSTRESKRFSLQHINTSY